MEMPKNLICFSLIQISFNWKMERGHVKKIFLRTFVGLKKKQKS